jgi:uncharacterized protein YggU (UPF0235/DUF167 family)
LGKNDKKLLFKNNSEGLGIEKYKIMLIKVRVFAGEKTEELIKKSDDSYIIKVREKAERGEANKRVREILADCFKVNEGKVKLIKGGKRPNKIFEILN